MARKSAPDTESIEDRLQNANDMPTGDTVCLYGPSGTGKTTLAATFPKPMIYLDVREKTQKVLKGIKGIRMLRIKSFQDFEDTYWYIKKNRRDFKGGTVVVDTIGQLQDLRVKEVSDQQKKKTNKKPGEWGSMTHKAWGVVASDLKTWIQNYRDLAEYGINVVFIAQDRVNKIDEEDEDDDEAIIIAPEVGPMVMPSVAKTLNASVDILASTFIMERWVKTRVDGKIKAKREVDYCLRIGPHSLYRTKIRQPKSVKVPAFIRDPSYKKLVNPGEV